MTIRSRLLSLLLPALSLLIGIIALFLYFNWSHEILNSFKNRLQSVVIAGAPSVSPEKINWISNHIKEGNLNADEKYESYRQKLVQLKQELPIDNLYIVRIEPIKKGDFTILNKSSKKIYETGDKNEITHKQVFLLDASHTNPELVNAPGDTDFSETDENKIYYTKKSIVTPIYESRKTGERFMSAYAPILNEQGDVTALLGADMSVEEIDRKLHNALLAIFTSAIVTLLAVSGIVYLIASRISQPVQKLNQAALDIAAGNYEADIHVEGPKEIVELANTFNTMSECLVEHISRLREGSLIRERMYGEYECGLLMQHYMLKKVVDDFIHPYIQMRLTSINLSNIQKGILLKYDQDHEKNLHLVWIEAPEQGFEEILNLNKVSSLPIEQLENYPYCECTFEKNASVLHYKSQNLFPPLIWSLTTQEFKKGKEKVNLNNKDMIFLYNSGFINQFHTVENVEKWFSKILRHFAEDGLDIIHTMLANELTFLTKRENLKENFQILSMQLKLTDQTSEEHPT